MNSREPSRSVNVGETLLLQVAHPNGTPYALDLETPIRSRTARRVLKADTNIKVGRKISPNQAEEENLVGRFFSTRLTLAHLIQQPSLTHFWRASIAFALTFGSVNTRSAKCPEEIVCANFRTTRTSGRGSAVHEATQKRKHAPVRSGPLKNLVRFFSDLGLM